MMTLKEDALLTLIRRGVCAVLFSAACGHLHAQDASAPKLDLAVTYDGERSLRASTSQTFWMQGGSIELGANVWHGWGSGAEVTGTHASAIGSTNIPLSLVTATFGPRYRWHADGRVSIYGQGLLGEANGFRSLFPTPAGAQTQANSLAVQVGGGVDLRLRKHVAVRALEASWLRTQLPNATNDIQNTLRLGAGIVLRFGQ